MAAAQFKKFSDYHGLWRVIISLPQRGDFQGSQEFDVLIEPLERRSKMIVSLL
jgi:hypothetical protein